MLCTMQKNIRKLASPFREGDWPHLVCPVCGEGGLAVDQVDWDYGGANLNLWEMLTVRTILPPIPVLDLSDDVPESVRAAALRAAALIWLDPLAFAGALRTAVEYLMDEHRILVRPPGAKQVGLHDRLENFEKVQPQAGKLLLAAKWIGNTGAHETTPFTASDALDTAELVEVALGILYVPDNSALLARADRINTAKRLVP